MKNRHRQVRAGDRASPSRWLFALPVLALFVAGYTLIDFIGSASDLQRWLSPPASNDAAVGGEPAQESSLVSMPTTHATPMPIATASVPTGSDPPRVSTASVAVARSESEISTQDYDDSTRVAGESGPDAYSALDTSPDEPTREARRAHTYTLLETAKATGDPDGSIRLLLQDAVRDPDSEVAYLARSALWQLQAGQDRQATESPAD